MPAVQSRFQKTGDIAASLLAHYAKHGRDLPWRKLPGRNSQKTLRPDPYHVWLSEIMLQQTTVAAVIPYFARFTSRWPDFAAFAAADDADVMAEWAGLGYYARARNLIACARVVVAEHGGQLPSTEAGLLALPGVGPYTAAAITTIAFGGHAVVVDANIERVVSRLFAISTPLPAAKSEIRAGMAAITPADRAGDFAQAMMDLGAGICSVLSPSCLLCPIALHCDANHIGTPAAFPVKAPKKAKPHRTGTSYWIQRDGMVWLVRRGDKGMLAGMRALPDDGWSARSDGDGVAPLDTNWQILPVHIAHGFTHFTLTLSIAVTTLTQTLEPSGEGEWWPVNSLDKAGLPTLFKKAADAVLETRA